MDYDDDFEFRLNYLPLLQAGKFELETIALLENTLKEGDIFIDAGCSFGFFTIRAARLVGATGKVISFDPSPRSVQTVKKNAELNELKNVEVVHSALGNSDNEITFYGGNYGGTTVKGNPQYDTSRGFVTQLTKLDTYLAGLGLKEVQLIKIDAEGFDFEIIKGCKETLVNSKDLRLTFEVCTLMLEAAETDPEEIFLFLEKLGYSCFIDITTANLQSIDTSNIRADLCKVRYGVHFGAGVGTLCEVLAMRPETKEKYYPTI